jgi:hypothetical protein
VRRSLRKPRTFRSRAFMHAIESPPMYATSWATETLETVARPRWLSGIRKASTTGFRTWICSRTISMSGRRGGWISQRTANSPVSRNEGGGGGGDGTPEPDEVIASIYQAGS